MSERSPTKVLLVTYGMSRQGGIEEVSRQVAVILNDAGDIRSRIVVYEGGVVGRLTATAKVAWWLLAGYRPMIMHPYIFEKLKGLALAPSRWIVWAYGIDVWGEFGRRMAPALSRAGLVVAISRYTKDRVLENNPNANVKVVWLSIEPPRTKLETGARRGNELITVGRLAENERYKGHDLVIRALSLLKQRGLEPVYHVIGKGGDLPRLQALAHSQGVANQVVFHGYVPDGEIEALYARASVFVMPSYVRKSETEMWGGEGFGLVYLEAGLRGLPVIACREGGQADCIVDGETGFLVEPSSEAVAEKIELLLSNPELARRMGEAARRHVADTFSMDRFRENVLALVKPRSEC